LVKLLERKLQISNMLQHKYLSLWTEWRWSIILPVRSKQLLFA